MRRLALLSIFMALPLLGHAIEKPCGALYFIPSFAARYQPEVPVVLYLPHSFPRVVRIKEVGNGGEVFWRGLSCDQVYWPIGTTFHVLVNGERTSWLYTVEEDGSLSFEYDPLGSE